MNTQIDLSKACIGQYITLRNNQKFRIGDITKSPFQCSIWSFCNELSAFYKLDGKSSDGESEFDIIAIEDSIEVKITRLEGKIEAYDNIAGMIKHEFMRDFLIEKLEFRRQLKALQDENS